jgi:hypothetical protein
MKDRQHVNRIYKIGGSGKTILQREQPGAKSMVWVIGIGGGLALVGLSYPVALALIRKVEM